MLVFCYVLVGTPFSWGKCAGGFQLSWVGYYLDAQTFAVGLSDSRAAWLLRWARETTPDVATPSTRKGNTC